MTLTPTASQTVGPYLHLGLTDRGSVARVAGEGIPGERISLIVRVLDGNRTPVPDAMIELWQADAAGKYRDHASVDPAFRGFGRLATGADGSCTFETIKPGRVPWKDGRAQAPHINVSVLGRGLLKRLATRIYFAGDPANEEDAVLALVTEDRRRTLLAHSDSTKPGNWIFEVRLRGEGETVFFDV